MTETSTAETRLDASSIENAATSLLEAYGTRTPIEPLSERHPGAPLSDAYRIQSRQAQVWAHTGNVVRGHKIGLASRAMQEQMGVDQPDYGHLTARMFHPEHEPLAPDAFIQPRIEPEIAFVLGSRLYGPGATVADAVRAVDFLLPALEIVDSRIRDWHITIFDTIADNASTGAVVLGGMPADLDDVNLALVGCVISKNGTVAEAGAGGAVLGSPLNALVWLANTLGAMGTLLEPGHVVLSGSMTRALPLTAGDTVTASIDGIGTVTTAFTR
jgi:2-keto-4-pentenoate hydratase